MLAIFPILLLTITSVEADEEVSPNIANDYYLSEFCNPELESLKNKQPLTTDNKIHLQSDSVNIQQEDTTVFTGDVVIEQDFQRLTSDVAKYKKATQDVTATGNVNLSRGGLELTGDSMNLNLTTNLGDVNNATYHDIGTRAQGTAETIVIKSKSILEMHDATYTTCDGDSPDWELSASTITLNNESHQGSASNVVIKFKSVPFLYLPYLQFPIGNERQSGFLFPGFASSEKDGLELYAPYYWNIHPQVDATIIPHYIEKRGTQLKTELRYLTAQTLGTLDIDTLPNDSKTDTDRNFLHWQHAHNPTGGWSSNVDISYASDKTYLDDFGGNLESTTQTNLERRIDIQYDAKDWLFKGRAQSFQTLSGDEQTKRLPQFSLNTRQLIKPNEFNTSFQSELTRFAHSTKAPIGNRLVLQPSVSLPLTHPAAYATFLTSLHYTQYDLDRTTSTQEDKPTRTVPIFSIDSGLFLERDSGFLGKKYLHTLEPRLQYLYIPYREQSTLPIFDSASISNDFSQLFSDNRYSGADRINDANQITYGLTSRYINLDSGAEVLTASLGQTFHFADSRVTLSGEPVRKESWNDLQFDLSMEPLEGLRINGTMTRNQQTREIDKRDLRLQYKLDKDRILNVDYRFQRDSSKTRELSGIWRITPQWMFIARKHNDLRLDRELESVYGFQYDSCCWSLRFVNRRYYSESTPSDPYQKIFFIEFELRGLSSFGRKKDIDSLLNRGILGYSN